MYHFPLIPSIPPSLSDQLRRQTNELRSRIIKTNYNTQFVQTASDFAGFRDAIAGLVSRTDDDTLLDCFQRTVPFTTYDSYAPFIARLFEEPLKASSTANLFAPGLPDYIARSSSTSGGLPKFFPKYDCLSTITTLDAGLPDLRRRRTTAHIAHFWCDPMGLEDENRCPVKTVYITGISVIIGRQSLNLHPGADRAKMATFVLDHVAPYAAHFVRKWRSFLLIHMLFALSSKSLESITISYTTTFVDMMRHLDTEFDMVVDCIANGTIPDLEGTAEVREFLQMNISPDPERAMELRALGRPSSRPGWCGYVWPNMHSITTTTSGSFATYTPLAQWFLGPNMDIYARGYGSTECGMIAAPYNPLESNQYKLAHENVIEFLEVNGDESIGALVQAWEVEPGKRYEIALTNKDGLWRYRLGDIIEISGFDPTDGVPIIQFIERRGVAIRFPWFMVTEEELSAAISALVQSTQAQIVGWTSVIDDRGAPSTIGFFIELSGDVTESTLATKHVFNQLSRSNRKIKDAIEYGSFRKPTIRLVQPRTFTEFLQLKLDETGSNNFAQVKVPAVLFKAAHVTWFSNRALREL